MIYDVVVVGGGPAGGQCARELAATGHKVLLAERQPSFEKNSFSTAGAPIHIVDDFKLSEECIGCRWHNLRFATISAEQVWESEQVRGVVLDFAELRAFLAREIETNGGEVCLGHPYRSHTIVPEGVQVAVGDQTVTTQVLVDATGAERKVIGRNGCKGQLIEGIGIEKLIAVEPSVYERWSDTLSFFFGAWMPHGYAWIFPMEPNRLKVGVGRYLIDPSHQAELPSYDHSLHELINHVVQGTDYIPLDHHGKRLAYRTGRRDHHVSGPIIAIGDAISTLNPLAFEGIRHGMWSGRYAAEAIGRYLAGDKQGLARFPAMIKRYCGVKWRLCERMMFQAYGDNDESWYLAGLRAYSNLSTDQIHKLCFEYNIREITRFLHLVKRESRV